MTDLIVDLETTGLDPLKDRIVAIGISGAKGPRVIMNEDEQIMLAAFWAYINTEKITSLVGFKFDFDWQFLKLRSLYHRIRIRHFEKYKERTDLRLVLNPNSYQKGTALSDYCAFLGITDGDGISGADIPKLYEEGKFEEIKKHLEWDLKKTNELFERMRECGVV